MIPSIQPVTFGAKNILKEKYLNGELPLEKGFYGGELYKGNNKTNCTLEHLVPKSKGGSDELCNIVLATAKNNNKRGNQPLFLYINKKAMDEYLENIEKSGIPELLDYPNQIRQTITRILEEEKKLGKKLDIIV